MPMWYRVLYVVTALGFILGGTVIGRDGRWWFMLLPIVVSPLTMVLLRQTMEYGRPGGLLNWRTQSWSFLFGDSIFLPLGFLGGALAWQRLGVNVGTYYHQWWWVVVSAAIGVAAGVAFRYLLNTPGYRAPCISSTCTNSTHQWRRLSFGGDKVRRPSTTRSQRVGNGRLRHVMTSRPSKSYDFVGGAMI